MHESHPESQKRRPGAPDSKSNPIHILLVCLAVVAAVFAGSIFLSVLYVQRNHGVQTDQPTDP